MIFNRDNRIPAWQVARQDPAKFNQSMAVGRIFNKFTNSSGTAFRIGPENRMMTNAHVMTSGNPRDYQIDFTDANGRVTSVQGDRLLAFSSRPGGDNPRLDTRTRQNLDFALFTINPSQFSSVKKFGYLGLDTGGARPGQAMYIPQYSDKNGQLPKSIVSSDDAQGGVQPSRIGQVYQDRNVHPSNHNQTVQFTADTKPGSSGSPVISADTHQVVALNNGRNWNQTNAATNMASIWQQVKGFFGQDASSSVSAGSVRSTNQPQQNRQHQIGERRNNNGTVQEWWKNPSGGTKWVDVWQPKNYSPGALVVQEGKAYSCLGPASNGDLRWASVFDPGQKYPPNERVYYYGRIMDANQLSSDLARRRNTSY